MKRYQKILLGSILGVLILIGGVQIYFSFFLDSQLKQTMVNRFYAATNDAYTLNIGSLDLELLGRKLTISDITLSQKNDTTNTDLSVTMEKFTVSGIGFMKLLFSQSLNVKEVSLIKPTVSFTNSPSDTKSKKTTEWHTLSSQLSNITLQIFNQVTIPTFSIRNLSVVYNRSDLSANPYLAFQNSDIHLYDISIDSTSLTDDRIIPSDNITTAFQDIRYQTKDGMYDVSTKQLAFSSLDNRMNINSLAVQPKFDKETFAKQFDHEIDRISIKIGEMNARGIDSQKLNRAEGLTAQRVAIAAPDIDIYRDKRPPFPPNNRPPLPQQMIRNIPFPINIDSLTLSKGNIRYSERVPKATKSGYIELSDFSATVQNLTNIENQWAGTATTLTAQTNIMGKAELNARFRFPMDSRSHYISGSLTAMHMRPLNQALEPLAFVRIDDGQIWGMDFEMDLNEHHASGNMTFQYKNLKISLLDKGKNKGSFGNKMKSLLANTFKVKSDNTGENIRTGAIYFERETNKSVFNYWWKSLLSGLKSSIGL